MTTTGRNDPAPFGDILAAAEQAYRAALPAEWKRSPSAALADARYEIIAASSPTAAASLAVTLLAFAEFFGDDWTPGDVALTNDVFRGCSHPTEFTAVSPIFTRQDGAIQGWFAIRAELPDIGGWSLGGYTSRALDIWAEGVRIVPVKLVQAGRLRREIVEILGLNSRTARLNQGCARAFAAAAQTVSRHADLSGIEPQTSSLIASCREKALARLATLPQGLGIGAGSMRGPDGRPIGIDTRIEIRADTIKVDFPNAPPAVEHPINATAAMVADSVLRAAGVHLALSPNDILGLAKLLEVRVPPGSLLGVTQNAPVGHARHLTCPAVEQAVRAALSALGISAIDRGRAADDKLFAPSLDANTGTLDAAEQHAMLAIEARLGAGQ